MPSLRVLGSNGWPGYDCEPPAGGPAERIGNGVFLYFDIFERVLEVDRLTGPVWPKDPAAPICACFGFGRDEIEADIREGSVQRTREQLDKAGSPAAHCATASASGHSCVPDVQRYYMKHRNPS
jgi:hypothetical protein